MPIEFTLADIPQGQRSDILLDPTMWIGDPTTISSRRMVVVSERKSQFNNIRSRWMSLPGRLLQTGETQLLAATPSEPGVSITIDPQFRDGAELVVFRHTQQDTDAEHISSLAELYVIGDLIGSTLTPRQTLRRTNTEARRPDPHFRILAEIPGGQDAINRLR